MASVGLGGGVIMGPGTGARLKASVGQGEGKGVGVRWVVGGRGVGVWY